MVPKPKIWFKNFKSENFELEKINHNQKRIIKGFLKMNVLENQRNQNFREKYDGEKMTFWAFATQAKNTCRK